MPLVGVRILVGERRRTTVRPGVGPPFKSPREAESLVGTVSRRCGCSSMAEHPSSKRSTRVRFLPAALAAEEGRGARKASGRSRVVRNQTFFCGGRTYSSTGRAAVLQTAGSRFESSWVYGGEVAQRGKRRVAEPVAELDGKSEVAGSSPAFPTNRFDELTYNQPTRPTRHRRPDLFREGPCARGPVETSGRLIIVGAVCEAGGPPGPGAIDQLADHLILSQEVRGSSPRSSTSVRS